MSDIVRSAASRPETQERRSGCEFGVVIKKDDAVDDGLEWCVTETMPLVMV